MKNEQILYTVGDPWLRIHSINLQARYEIYAIIDTGEHFYWDGTALFSNVMVLIYTPLYIVGTHLISSWRNSNCMISPSGH